MRNVAELTDTNLLFAKKIIRQEGCVFISHKKEDEPAAIVIGEFLQQVIKVNIYLDIRDVLLREAVSEENDGKIVASIQKGLECSSHLLCLISEKTNLSWWVPYEIGFADKLGLTIASLKLRYVDDVPSYIKTRTVIRTMSEFIHYASMIPYGKFLSQFQKPVEFDKTNLEKYIG